MLAKTKAKTRLIIEMVVPVFGKNPKILSLVSSALVGLVF